MASLPGSRECIAHWFSYGRWHRCTKKSPHRGAQHACGCGLGPSGFLSPEVHLSRQSFRHLEATGALGCPPKEARRG